MLALCVIVCVDYCESVSFMNVIFLEGHLCQTI